MEKFRNGAHPYLRLSIRNDRPEELGLQIFAEKNSAKMESLRTHSHHGKLFPPETHPSKRLPDSIHEKFTKIMTTSPSLTSRENFLRKN